MKNQFNRNELVSIKNMSFVLEQKYSERKNKTSDKDVIKACENLIEVCKNINTKTKEMLKEF